MFNNKCLYSAIATTLATTTTFPDPIQAAQAILPRDAASGSSNTGVVVGAVLGSVLGTMVLITFLYKCCFDNRSAAWIPTASRYYESDSDSERTSHSGIHTRGGGFGRENRHGDRVRRPRRARTRRHRHRDDSESRSHRSHGSRYSSGRKNASGMNNNDGLLGWFLVPRTTPYRSSEKRHIRTSWPEARSTADD